MNQKFLDEKSEILIQLTNNTGQSQDINLFDNGDPTSGGAFSYQGLGRSIQYDLSSFTFPTGVAMQVILNNNSEQVPVLKMNGFVSNALTYNSLLTFLNSLGIGTFNDLGSQKIECLPNYPLAGDNGGIEGAEMNIEQAGSFLMWFKGSNGSLTGNCSVNDINASSFDLAEPFQPGSGYSGTNINLINGYGQKQISFTGTAVSNFTAEIIKNGITIYTFNGVVGSNSYTFPELMVNQGDTVYFSVLASTIVFQTFQTGETFSGSGSSTLIDTDNPVYNATLTITPNANDINADVQVNLGNKQVSVTGTTTSSYTITIQKNSTVLYTSSGVAGSISYTSPAFTLAASDLLVVTITNP